MQSPSKSVTNQKRDIVDTLFHASRAFGHDPMLGLAFSHTWEMESEDRRKGNQLGFEWGLAFWMVALGVV